MTRKRRGLAVVVVALGVFCGTFLVQDTLADSCNPSENIRLALQSVTVNGTPTANLSSYLGFEISVRPTSHGTATLIAVPEDAATVSPFQEDYASP